MNIAFRHEAQFIKAMHDLFSSHGYEIRLVGGAVRDILQNIIPKDLDFCTTATPDQMLAMANQHIKVFPTGIDHGTVTFMSLWGTFEVTTLRKDIECDGRHASVEFTDSWEEDAARRDFTINAMSMDVTGKVYDYFNGQEDLKNGIVRFVGDADQRIKEDALRIIRYFRFTTRIGAKDQCPEFDSQAIEAITKNLNLLETISVERIWDEYKKVCKSNPDKLSLFYIQLKLSCVKQKIALPSCNGWNLNLDRMKDYARTFPTFAVASCCKNDDIALEFCEKYKLSSQEKEEVLWFINAKQRWPQFDDFGFDTAEDLINENVCREWIKAFAAFHNNGFLEEGIDSIEKSEFPISGADLIDRGYEQGPSIGKKLNELKTAWKTSRYTMDRNKLLELI